MATTWKKRTRKSDLGKQYFSDTTYASNRTYGGYWWKYKHPTKRTTTWKKRSQQ